MRGEGLYGNAPSCENMTVIHITESIGYGLQPIPMSSEDRAKATGNMHSIFS